MQANIVTTAEQWLQRGRIMRNKREELERKRRKIWVITDMFTTLIVMLDSQVYTHVKIYSITYFKYMPFSVFNYVSIKMGTYYFITINH